VRVTATERHIRIPKPLYTRELLLIEIDALIPLGADDIPQRYIYMAKGRTYGRCASNHQRFRDAMSRNKPQFLMEFARYSFSRVLARLDMTSGREPELCVFVVHE
jgi:hypothetical protein